MVQFYDLISIFIEIVGRISRHSLFKRFQVMSVSTKLVGKVES